MNMGHVHMFSLFIYLLFISILILYVGTFESYEDSRTCVALY